MNYTASVSTSSTQGSSHQADPPAQRVPVFDLEAALEVLGCIDLVREAAEAYVGMAPSLRSETALALSRRDWPGLRMAAHTWKGSTGYLGVSTIVRLAALLEAETAAARVGGLEAMVERLLAGTGALAAELTEWIAADATTAVE